MKKSCCKGRINAKGFTLIEVLVVVLIIAVLAAVALPQYQKAVLKSRYSGLMPIASAVANGQEIYYMDKGHYSTDITQLDIKAPSGGASAEIEVNDGSDERFDYVLTTRDDVPGLAYVVYQKHSPQFADTVMCEANDELNPKATWLCHDSLKGEEVTSGSLLGDGWTAYLLKGVEGNNTFVDQNQCEGEAPTITASRSGASSTAECVNGEWKFTTWQNGSTYSGTICDGNQNGNDQAYACSGATFENGAKCYGQGEYECSNSTFTSGAECFGGDSGNPETYDCSGSIFTNGAYCQVGCNSSTGCSGAIIKEGGYCRTLTWNGQPTGSCAGAIIEDGGWCAGNGCDSAVYHGTGCCSSGCPVGSGAPKCTYHPMQVGTGMINDGWDGETVW